MALILPAQGVGFMHSKPFSRFGQSISTSNLSLQREQSLALGSIFCGNASAILLCLSAT